MNRSLPSTIGSVRYEALWPAHLFDDGVGWIIVARFKPGGRRVPVGVFLVDVFCLGAKLAVYEKCDVQDYRQRISEHYVANFALVAVEPGCARQLLEQAVQYARHLGFAPHPDDAKASRVFADAAIEAGDRQFTFGFKGKPFYRRGPRETEAQARSIIRHLEQRCGQGNYDYLVRLGDAEQISRDLGYQTQPGRSDTVYPV